MPGKEDLVIYFRCYRKTQVGPERGGLPDDSLNWWKSKPGAGLCYGWFLWFQALRIWERRLLILVMRVNEKKIRTIKSAWSDIFSTLSSQIFDLRGGSAFLASPPFAFFDFAVGWRVVWDVFFWGEELGVGPNSGFGWGDYQMNWEWLENPPASKIHLELFWLLFTMFPSGQVQQHRQEFADAKLWVSAPEKKVMLEKSNAKKVELQTKKSMSISLYASVILFLNAYNVQVVETWLSKLIRLMIQLGLSKSNILKVPARSTLSHQLFDCCASDLR